MTENDDGVRLYNRDGRRGDRPDLTAVRDPLLTPVGDRHGLRDDRPREPSSQFDTAAVLLSAPDSRVLTREPLYTAVTRAYSHLMLSKPKRRCGRRWSGQSRGQAGCGGGCVSESRAAPPAIKACQHSCGTI
jgi:hypothetical protein